MPVALAVDWDTIEKSAIAGLSFTQLAEIHGVPDGTIRQRALRYKWPVPRRIKAIAREMHAQGVPGVSLCNDRGKNEEMARVTVETLQEAHSRTAAALVQAAARGLARFAEAAPAPENWQEAATAYKVQRLAAGIDKEGGEVRVNVAMFAEALRPVDEGESWGGVSTPVIIPAQVAESEA